MKKLLLSLVFGASCLTTTTFAQSIQKLCTYTGPQSSVTLDYDNGYGLIQLDSNKIQVVKIDQNCTGTVVRQDVIGKNILYGMISAKGDSVVYAIHTADGSFFTQASYLNTVITSSQTLRAGIYWQTTEFTRSHDGIITTRMSSDDQFGFTINKATFTKVRYDGTIAPAISANEPNTYHKVLADKDYVYAFYSNSNGTSMEKRQNNSLLSYVDTYPIDLTANMHIADAVQTDTSVVLMLTPSNGAQLVKKNVMKSNGTFFNAQIPHSVNIVEDGSAAKYVYPTVSMFSSTLIKHGSSSFGQIALIDSTHFTPVQSQGYNTTVLNNTYFIWSGVKYASNTAPLYQKIKVVLVKSDLSQKDSLVIQDDTENFPMGQALQTDKTFAIWGVSGSYGGANPSAITGKAKVWKIGASNIATIVSTPPQSSVECSIYPNPAQSKITVKSTEMLHDIIVYNQIGGLCKVMKAHGKQMTIDISELCPGIYQIEVATESNTITTKRFLKVD